MHNDARCFVAWPCLTFVVVDSCLPALYGDVETAAHSSLCSTLLHVCCAEDGDICLTMFSSLGRQVTQAAVVHKQSVQQGNVLCITVTSEDVKNGAILVIENDKRNDIDTTEK